MSAAGVIGAWRVKFTQFCVYIIWQQKQIISVNEPQWEKKKVPYGMFAQQRQIKLHIHALWSAWRSFDP